MRRETWSVDEECMAKDLGVSIMKVHTKEDSESI